MKLNDIKHNHSLTDLLKVLLFSIIMCLPFLDVGTRCAYVIANKNAYQSYSEEYVESSQTFVNANDLANGGIYQYQYNDVGSNATNTNKIGYTSISLDLTNYLPSGNNYHAIAIQQTYIIGYYMSNGSETLAYGTDYAGHNLPKEINNFTFTNDSQYTANVNGKNYYFLQVIYKQDKLDNVFEYSISQLENSQLYNWTMQTAVYSGISTMTAQLGIQGNIIPIILCYWLFITIIYILIDIVIKLFTLLTHALGSKAA